MNAKFKAAILSLLMAMGGHSAGVTAEAANASGSATRTSYVAKGGKKSTKSNKPRKNTRQQQPVQKVVEDEDPLSKGVPSKRPAGARRKGFRPNEEVKIDTISDESLRFIMGQDQER